ncbi:Crp/Fnr family transcriptional regulator [Siphonobacter sp. SORGH_AS_1065]|uniref:Crp/Fnr family transcriptional regulator n=1 Tax=Siphonobacter sp. SORGH_AS_1065 TaxID=3041795 RepID=UPI00277FD909|nr:Crp/Fnr family transcriptional regulator [Siphonobacter sp. SORGH_AS_1065]MDQ1090260.1 CRP-like cAMP-binding protein [Siphonobacter sp. SORGH_AS_1065]
MTTQLLKHYCQQFVSLTSEELALLDTYFVPLHLQRHEFLLQEGHVCQFIAFVNEGIVRHFHTKEGVEKTCDFSFQHSFLTDFTSLTHRVPSIFSLQALQETDLLLIKRENLLQLYQQCPKYETFGRLMAEMVAQRATEIAMSLSSEKPEERYKNLLKKHPDLFQKVQQKYIANFLGISPESLSRIRKRIALQERS